MERHISLATVLVCKPKRNPSAVETCLSRVGMNLSTTEMIAWIHEINASAMMKPVSQPEAVLSAPEKIISASQIIFSVTEKIAKNS
jgi:hypothetical protein